MRDCRFATQPRTGAFRMAELPAFERIQFSDSVAVDALRGRAIVDQPAGAHEQHPVGDDEGVTVTTSNTLNANTRWCCCGT